MWGAQSLYLDNPSYQRISLSGLHRGATSLGSRLLPPKPSAYCGLLLPFYRSTLCPPINCPPLLNNLPSSPTLTGVWHPLPQLYWQFILVEILHVVEYINKFGASNLYTISASITCFNLHVP